MRRKSERTATKKTKPSPEKKIEKVKRTRTRRSRKQSSSSENESADETSPVREVEAVVEPEQKPPSTPVKEDSPEEAQDQVWQVKTAESSGDGGEIQKLKICLTRPPSTPERVDRSPRSKRKLSRATSSSDTPSIEAGEERKKKHRSKRSTRESKDESDKNHDSQGDEQDTEPESQKVAEKFDHEVTQSTETQKEAVSDETPMSTTNEDVKTDDSKKSELSADEGESQNKECNEETEAQKGSDEKGSDEKASDADTTVASPKAETTGAQDSQSENNTSSERESPKRKRSVSVEKSEVLEIHADESKSETLELTKSEEEERNMEKPEESRNEDRASRDTEVSINQDKTHNTVSEEVESTQNHNFKATNENDVVESSQKREKMKTRKMSTDSDKDKEARESDKYTSKQIERSDSTQSAHDETVYNGQAAPIVVSRKRRWGSRPSKITNQKSITISTDVLKEIIPDVKPVEFEEVIEEKKHRRIEVTERIERPVLPKIIIDNSENVEQHRKEQEHKDKENVKTREPLSTNRRISIVKDNDSILTRPPSPPRHKQSNILFITNLVRPFTLPQLKNLLQRTGRIVENGFWIDRIKSKCFVKYENEDQAVETRHALHGVTWPVSNPKTLQVDFSTQEAFDKAKLNEDTDNAQASTIPGTVEDWLREQDQKRERGELEKPWERKAAMREWDMGKNEKEKEKEKDKERLRRDDRSLDKRRHRTPERSPEPAKKFKKKEEEAPAKLLDDLFRKTKTTPCIYWLPLSAETIAVKEEQRRQHMAEHERRLQELRRTHRRH